jgi:hypothetical protein
VTKSNVLRFHRPDQQERSCPGRSEILINVAALISKVGNLQIQTTGDVHQAIFILDLANTCLRLFISQIQSETAKKQLLIQSATIDQLIEATRSKAPVRMIESKTYCHAQDSLLTNEIPGGMEPRQVGALSRVQMALANSLPHPSQPGSRRGRS